MTELLIALAAVCGFMVLQDVLGSGLTVSQARDLRTFPGVFDGLGDYANRYGGAVVAVVAVRFGLWSWQNLVVITACAVTSFFASNAATERWSVVLPADREHQGAVRETLRRLLHRRPAVATVARPAPAEMSREARATTEREPPMSLVTKFLATIASRFRVRTVVSEVQQAAHSQAADILKATAESLVGLVPDSTEVGREVSLLLTKLEEAGHWIDTAIARAHAAQATDPAPTPDTGTAPSSTAAPTESTSTDTQPSSASADPATPPATAPGNSPTPPATTAPTGLFTTTLPVTMVPTATWPTAPYTTPDGAKLYSWAGSGAAPETGNWTPYSGPVVAVPAPAASA